jgi:MtaA/CmuA family methyltransferase
MNGRERVFAMLAGAKPDHLPLMPITMMFAARHIGAKYRDYARDHRVMAEAQMRTAETYDFDYVSGISDPAREASDLGAAVEWFEDQPPAIIEERALLADKNRFIGLRVADASSGPRMSDRVEGVRLMREQVGGERIVEGWVEGPCAMAADLRGLNNLMLDFFDDAEFVRDLFAFTVEMELGFALAQIDAGADLIGVGDAAASLVGPKLYEAFAQPYERVLIRGIHDAGVPVRLHICGKTRKLYRGMAATDAELIELDSMSPLAEARAEMGPGPILLGNLDPVRVMRDGTPAEVEAGFAECHRQAGEKYILAAGCEVPVGTPEENLRAAARYAQAH